MKTRTMWLALLILLLPVSLSAWAQSWTSGSVGISWELSPPTTAAKSETFQCTASASYNANMAEGTEWAYGSPSINFEWQANPDGTIPGQSDTGTGGANGSFSYKSNASVKYDTASTQANDKTVKVRAHVTGSITDYGADGELGGGDDVTYTIDQRSDWISVDLTVYDIQLKAKRKTTSTWQTSGVVIAAGGKDTDVHKADIYMSFGTLPANTAVQVRLTGNGGGHSTSGTWPFNRSAVKAKLVMDGVTYTHGDSTPLSFTAPSTLTGVLSSSNKEEVTSIELSIPSLSITKVLVADFSGGTIGVNLGAEELPFNTWRSFTMTHTLDSDVITGHEMKIVVGEVRYMGADGVLVTKLAELGSDSSSSRPLTEYVQLDQDAWFNHDYDSGTTGSSGLASELRMVDARVRFLKIDAYDFDVWK